uniref:Uncharacterized protein n=1 Tax=Suricata suricatta TaxID=37032 RepID=A0A673UH08_SURSU
MEVILIIRYWTVLSVLAILLSCCSYVVITWTCQSVGLFQISPETFPFLYADRNVLSHPSILLVLLLNVSLTTLPPLALRVLYQALKKPGPKAGHLAVPGSPLHAVPPEGTQAPGGWSRVRGPGKESDGRWRSPPARWSPWRLRPTCSGGRASGAPATPSPTARATRNSSLRARVCAGRGGPTATGWWTRSSHPTKDCPQAPRSPPGTPGRCRSWGRRGPSPGARWSRGRSSPPPRGGPPWPSGRRPRSSHPRLPPGAAHPGRPGRAPAPLEEKTSLGETPLPSWKDAPSSGQTLFQSRGAGGGAAPRASEPPHRGAAPSPQGHRALHEPAPRGGGGKGSPAGWRPRRQDSPLRQER